MSDTGLHIDHDILVQAAGGEESAFRHLYDNFHRQVFNQAYSYLQSAERANDAVQEVFLKLWATREKLSEVRNFKSYLFIIARNIIISDLRKKVLHKYLDEEAAMVEEDTILPDKQLSYKESMELVQKAIDALPPQQKKAYTFSRTLGLNHEEIATEMNISPETVKTHIKQALKSLRKYLSDRHVDLAMLIIFILEGVGKK